jgi:hypothetical protein
VLSGTLFYLSLYAKSSENPKVIGSAAEGRRKRQRSGQRRLDRPDVRRQRESKPRSDQHALEGWRGCEGKSKAGRTAFYYPQYNQNLKGTDALKQLEEAI